MVGPEKPVTRRYWAPFLNHTTAACFEEDQAGSVEFVPSRRKYGESRAESKASNSVAVRNQHVGLIHTSRHDEESSVVDRPGFEFPGANPPGFTGCLSLAGMGVLSSAAGDV
jgi:hypothetical protein